MDVMSALVLSFIIGMGITFTKKGVLRDVFDEFHDIIDIFVKKVMIPIIPIYVLCVFVKISAAGHVQKILGSFSKTVLTIISIHTLVLFILYVIAGIVAKQNPFKLLKNMIPAYMTAVATQSSVAVIPVSVKSVLANNVSVEIANFVMPLCSTIHLSGSAISIVCNSIAVMIIYNKFIDIGTMIPFIFILGLLMVAAPGVPCGAIFAAIGMLQSVLGFDSSMIALIVSLHVAQDSFGTACNVTGDGAIAIIVEKIFVRKRTQNTH
jgi:Na+/H+-dicarboxylate symporter